MSGLVLPTKLNKEPLVDALFEIRFSSPVPAASSVLTGPLFSKLSATLPTQIERLPISDVPSQMRGSDPFLKYQPLLKLNKDDFMVMVGDLSIAVACQLPYPGWKLFKPKIIETVNIIKEANVIEFIERYSMKYVDIIEADNIAAQIKRTKIDLTIGNHKLISEPVTVRVEITRGSFIHIVQIATPASVTISGTGATKTGILVDVDTICNQKTYDLTKFTQELAGRLETIHTENKTMFLGPIYVLDPL
jgi:uncharacterized protein (TIGR04255 family)